MRKVPLLPPFVLAQRARQVPVPPQLLKLVHDLLPLQLQTNSVRFFVVVVRRLQDLLMMVLVQVPSKRIPSERFGEIGRNTFRERERKREVCVSESKRVKSERYMWPGVVWETFRISRQNEQDKRNRTNSVRARVKTNRTRINKTTDPPFLRLCQMRGIMESEKTCNSSLACRL
jgi:hypothetical protein